MNSEMKQNELNLAALEQVSGSTTIGGSSGRIVSGGTGSGSGGGIISSSASQHFAALFAHLQEGTHQPGAKYQS